MLTPVLLASACMIDILDKAAKFQVLSDAITPNNPD